MWQYVHNYLHGSSRESSPKPGLAEGAENVYSGKKYQTSTSRVDVDGTDEEPTCSQSTRATETSMEKIINSVHYS